MIYTKKINKANTITKVLKYSIYYSRVSNYFKVINIFRNTRYIIILLSAFRKDINIPNI